MVLILILGGYFGYKLYGKYVLEAELKIAEETMLKNEGEYRRQLQPLQNGKQTDECPKLVDVAQKAFDRYEFSVGDVNALRQKLDKETLPVPQRSSQLDLTCQTNRGGGRIDDGRVVQWPDKQLQSLLEKFKKAYEARNLEALRTLSLMSESRVTNVKVMFGNYTAFKASIQNIVPTKDGATAVLVLDTATGIDGKVTPIDDISREYKLQISRKGESWGKIVW